MELKNTYRSILLFLVLIISFTVYAEELKMISAENFLSANPSPERNAIVGFITHQFDSKRRVQITQEQLDDVWSNAEARDKLFMIRFQVVNQKLYAGSCYLEHDHFIMLLEYLQELVKKYKINDIDFIVYSGDDTFSRNLLSKTQKEIPTFLHSKDNADFFEKDRFLLPDSYLITKNWDSLVARIIRENDNHLWNNKINQIFWRGKSTGNGGMPYNINNFSKLPRLSLVILSSLYPDLIDTKLTDFYNFSEEQNGEDLKKVLNLLGNPAPGVSEERHLKYKYLISIDGNTCAWMRVPWIMLSNSVLVKQETSKMEWFYPSIKPYVHYVPVKEDLTDIFQQIEWMKTHDAELQQISQNAQNFVKNNLMPEDIEAHTVIILNEYSKLHKGKKIEPTLPNAEEIWGILEKKKKAEMEVEQNMPRKKKIKRFFKELKQKIRNLWS